MKNLSDNLLLRIPLTCRAQSASNQFAGATLLASGSATVVVSTSAVKSNSLLMLGVRALTDQASGFAVPIEVRTMVDGARFVLGYADGNAQARDATVYWVIVRR